MDFNPLWDARQWQNVSSKRIKDKCIFWQMVMHIFFRPQHNGAKFILNSQCYFYTFSRNIKYFQPFHSIGVYPVKFSDYYNSTLKQLCPRYAQVTKHIPQSFNMSFYWPISDLLLPFNFEKFRQLLAYHMGTHLVFINDVRFYDGLGGLKWPKNRA